MATSSYGALEASEGGAFEKEADAVHQTVTNEKRTTVLSRIVSTISVVMLTVVLMIATKLLRNEQNTIRTQSFKSSGRNDLSVEFVSNEYGKLDLGNMLPYSFLVGAVLLEPYRATIIAIEDPLDGCSYDWTITELSSDVISASGNSLDGTILATLQTVGEYRLSAKESCGAASDSKRSLNVKVWVKYVRRELSSLNDEDREEFLDAFHSLWTTSTTDGKALYGDRYKSLNYFATLHNDAGGNSVCDQFHGGYGFLSNHMYLSAYLEQSLQLINPKMALHYMEYSQYFESDKFQAHLSNQLDGGSWTELLTEKYFGSSDPYTGRITNGRWADTKVPYMTPDFLEAEGIDPSHTFFPVEESQWLEKSPPHLNSPYGLLRSPWNYNPSEYVARFGNVFRINDTSVFGENPSKVFGFHMGIGCSKYTKFFKNVRGDPLQTYLLNMEDDTHGIFHFTFAGVGGDKAYAAVETLINTYGFSYSNIGALTVSAQHYFKKQLAGEIANFPVNCTVDPWQGNQLMSAAIPGDVDGPTCDFAETYYDTETTLDTLVASFVNFDPDETDLITRRLQGMSFAERAGAMKTIANMFPIDGDLASSGGAMDPLFWVAHGAMERVFQKSVFEGIFSDMKFDTTSRCSGHDFASPKGWLEGFYFSDESVEASNKTNAELTAFLDPTTDEYRDLINFVYDTNSYSWCADSETWFG